MVSLVTGTIGLLAALCIVVLIRRDHLHVRFGLGWVVVAVGIALVGIFPKSVDSLAASVGIAYGPVLALTIGVTALVIKALLADIARSRMEARMQRLVQKIAFLEAQHQDAPDPDSGDSGGQ